MISRLVPLLIGGLMIFGACNTLLLALQDKQQFPDSPNSKFMHPFIQTGLVFLGEFLCCIPYALYAIKRNQNKLEYMDSSFLLKPKCPFYLPVIPAVADLLSSVCAYASLALVPASLWQMTRGANIITIALFYRIFMKKPFTRGGMLGCSLAFLGITSAQLLEYWLATEQGPPVSAQGTERVVGVVLLAVSVLANTITLVYEKHIFNKYQISPLKMVYIEGLAGLIGVTVLMALLQTVLLCPDWGSLQQSCLLRDGHYYFDNIFVFWEQVQSDHLLYYFCGALIFSIALSVGIAVTLSKVVNPVSRSLADLCRTILVWVSGLLLTVTLGKRDKQYVFEDTGLLLNGCKILSFLAVAYGTLLYHEVGVPVCLQEPYLKDSLLDSNDELVLPRRKSREALM